MLRIRDIETQQVLSFIDFKDRWAICTLVCKRWNHLVSKVPIYENVVLEHLTQQFPIANPTYIATFCSTVRYLCIYDNMHTFSEPQQEFLLPQFQNLIGVTLGVSNQSNYWDNTIFADNQPLSVCAVNEMLAQNINSIQQVKLVYNSHENKVTCCDFFEAKTFPTVKGLEIVLMFPSDEYELQAVKLLSSFPSVENMIVTIFEKDERQDNMLPALAQMREVKAIFASLKINIVHHRDPGVRHPDIIFVSAE